MKRIILIVAVLAGLLVVASCEKNKCGNFKEISWTDYNSVEAVYYYFACNEDNVMSHIGDTVRVTGYLDETFTSIGKPWIYMADQVWGPDMDYNHPRIPIDCSDYLGSVSSEFRGKRMFFVGIVEYMIDAHDAVFVTVAMDTVRM